MASRQQPGEVSVFPTIKIIIIIIIKIIIIIIIIIIIKITIRKNLIKCKLYFFKKTVLISKKVYFCILFPKRERVISSKRKVPCFKKTEGIVFRQTRKFFFRKREVFLFS